MFLRDVIILAGVIAMTVAVMASLMPVREGFLPVPQCTDCGFKLVGPYVVKQYGNYAALLLGGKEVARYAKAYYSPDVPLVPGENATCPAVWILDGVLYCGAANPRFGQRVYCASQTDGWTVC